MLPFLFDGRPKNAFFHQDMTVLTTPRAISAGSMSRGYTSVWNACSSRGCPRPSPCARRPFGLTALATLAWLSSIEFIPTWMDPEVFHPADAGHRRALRDELLNELGFSASSRVLIYVGRWDSQKDPLRLLRAFRALLSEGRDVALVLVGDGVLRGELQAFVRSHGLQRRVALAGPRPQPRVADWLRAVDLFVLSSAYEGMPMSVLEALGSGLPVATTDVGEVRRVVRPGVNGEIAGSRSVEDLVRAVADCLDRLDTYAGAPCTDAVADYVPHKVLAPVYETYRALAARAQERVAR
jgi:glycosyltransferase involved in cell wall biosynthesis